MQNIARPCSVELRLLSTLKHEKGIIESKINNGNCSSPETMAVVLKYIETRIKDIQERI
jgi:hypothetical protein